jgi:hypothetical protein
MKTKLPAVVLSVTISSLALMPAYANDSTGELSAGGITLARSDVIEMQKEELYLSRREVRVSYVFRNRSEEPVETIVAFPMPDIKADPYESIAFPADARDNFLNFKVEVNGEMLEPTLQQRAFAAGLDVTDDLVRAGIALVPGAAGQEAAIERLEEGTLKDFISRGILVKDEYDAGNGWETHHVPVWNLQSAYWWNMVFEPGVPTVVRHWYQPGIGGTAGLSFIDPDGAPGYNHDTYVKTYCIEEGLIAATGKLLARHRESGGEGYLPYYEQHLSYVLVTGANWAGPIVDFHLTVDKGSADALVSFCGDGVTKTGPTTFELHKTDFYPERDIEVLFLVKAE